MYSFQKDFYEVSITGAVGLCGFVSQIPHIIINGYQPINGSIMSMSLGLCLNSGVRFPMRYKKWKTYHNIMKKEEFKEEKNLYLEYVKDIAELLKSMDVSSDLVGAYLCKILIDGSILSENKIEFASYEYDKFDRFVDMMGSRVASGSFCCRHAASLVTDVINEMGGVACDVSVIRSDDKNSKDFFANHLVTGLEHEGKSVLFDPSIPSYLLPICGSIKFQTKKGKIVTSGFNDNLFYKEEISDFESLDVDEEMLGCYLEAFTTYLNHSDEIIKFKEEELPKIKRLAKLNRMVTPYYGKDKTSMIEG